MFIFDCLSFSINTDTFVRLYLDVGSLSGAHCHLAGDDDISLSSTEESKCDEDENESCQQEKTSEDSQSVCNNENDLVDLTESPQRPKSQPLSSSTDDQGKEVQRLSRIAKKFKKQYLQKSAQYKEQYKEKRKLSDKIRKAESELKDIKEEINDVKEDRDSLQLAMNHQRLDLERYIEAEDYYEKRCKTAEASMFRAKQELSECHTFYKKELDNARAKSMSEVQEIMEEHPKVVKENRELKQTLQKLQHQNLQLERMHRSLSRRNSSSSSNDSKDSSKRGPTKAKDIQKALRQMDEATRFPPKSSLTIRTAPKSTRPVNPFEKAASSVPKAPSALHGTNDRLKKVNTGNYSSLASRMMKASQKAKKPPGSGSKKRSAMAALSLSSQNKRMKSFSSSRRDLFQRKP